MRRPQEAPPTRVRAALTPGGSPAPLLARSCVLQRLDGLLRVEAGALAGQQVAGHDHLRYPEIALGPSKPAPTKYQRT
jgi:hypothetical protein